MQQGALAMNKAQSNNEEQSDKVSTASYINKHNL